MKIYLVSRWGNDDEGPNEADTNFIVLAPDYEAAAKVVDEELEKVKDSKAAKFCQRITELGESNSQDCVPKIILGPSIEHALLIDNVGIPDDKKWVRDSVAEGWEDYSDYY